MLAAQSAEDGTHTYLYGLDRIAQNSANGIEYFLPDALGSVRNLTTANGTVALTRSYEPFGSVQTSVGLSTTNYGFAGEWTDQTGLQHLRARYFEPELGRFISEDSWNGNYLLPSTLNHYIFGINNPLTYFDPTGNWPTKNPGDDSSDEVSDFISGLISEGLRTTLWFHPKVQEDLKPNPCESNATLVDCKTCFDG